MTNSLRTFSSPYPGTVNAHGFSCRSRALIKSGNHSPPNLLADNVYLYGYSPARLLQYSLS